MRSPPFIGPICRRLGHRLRRGCGAGPLFRLATGDFRSTGDHRPAPNRSGHRLLPRRVRQGRARRGRVWFPLPKYQRSERDHGCRSERCHAHVSASEAHGGAKETVRCRQWTRGRVGIALQNRRWTMCARGACAIKVVVMFMLQREQG